jgi:sucrose-phosphate synthase
MEDGPRSVLQDILLRIDRYNLYGKVAYPKRHEPDEAALIYRLAAKRRGVFVNPAWTEPFGLTLLEAAASGLPLAATDDGGPRDIVGQCKNGRLIDPFDPPKLAETLLEMLSDARRWKRWSRSGLREVHRHYTWEGHARRYLREVRKILGRPQRRKQKVDKSRLPAVDRILVTDIDNTLLGDSEALAELARRLRKDGGDVAFAVATGRRLQSAIDVLHEHGAPRPDFWITSVGSQIHYSPDFAEDKEWLRNISWRWNAALVRETLLNLPGLELQNEIDQGPHKVSFFIDPAKAPPMSQIERLLRKAGVRGKTIFSHGQFLDILPVRASKGLAVRFVAHRWGVPMHRVLVAGDSGNDEEMLSGHSLGVVVANYSEELEKLRSAEDVHFAKREYAWGILEGAEHYGFFDKVRSPATRTRA